MPILVAAQLNDMKTNDKNEYLIYSFHNSWDEAIVLPFLVFNNNSFVKLYKNPIFAIKIHEIVVNGLQIQGKPSHEFIDDINFESFSFVDQVFVYKVASNNLLFASTLTSTGDFFLKVYTIPKEAKEIVIVYQLRSADGLIGPMLTLKSVANGFTQK